MLLTLQDVRLSVMLCLYICTFKCKLNTALHIRETDDYWLGLMNRIQSRGKKQRFKSRQRHQPGCWAGVYHDRFSRRYGVISSLLTETPLCSPSFPRKQTGKPPSRDQLESQISHLISSLHLHPAAHVRKKSNSLLRPSGPVDVGGRERETATVYSV